MLVALLQDGSTMVIEACKGGHTGVVKLLLEWPNCTSAGSSTDQAALDTLQVYADQSSAQEVPLPVEAVCE